MTGRIPHPIPYQGSKRRLASTILRFAPPVIDQFLEPFAGSAAMTLAAAAESRARSYVVGDSLPGLAAIWAAIFDEPVRIASEYTEIWEAQKDDSRAHFARIRDEFNATQDAAKLLFLLARCVKNAVRFNGDGRFNQAADHRRRGMNPVKMRNEIQEAHRLLANKAKAVCADYGDLLAAARSKDFVYLDPPYQGVSGSDKRYYEQLDLQRLLDNLEELNRRGVNYVVSFDGACGLKSYGQALPKELRLRHVLIPAGRSSQATLSGRAEETTESLYLSAGLAESGR